MDTTTGALRRLILRTLLPGFDGMTVPAWLVAAHRDGLASVCLYGANIADPAAVSALCADLHRRCPGLLIATDEEGGDVTRLHYLARSPEPGNAVLGRLDDPALTAASARRIGRDLAVLGIGLDLGPVVDINSAPDNPVIGVRSFGATAPLVARHAVAWVRGLRDAGVAACAKHFPGHGDTTTDSHLALPRVDATREVLDARELEPFRAVVQAGIPAVMTSHIVVPALDPERPATFSPAVLRGELRGRLGFRGVIVTDALDMAGASGDIGIPEAAVRALAAGADLLCLGPNTGSDLLERVVATIEDAVAQGRIEPEELAASAARVQALIDDQATPSPAPAPGTDPRPEIADAFEIGAGAAAWLADDAPAAIVQVESEANLAVGRVVWGAAAVGATIAAGDVPSGAKVAVVARGLAAGHPALAVGDALRAAGHPVIVVECGWPRGFGDLVTYGASAGVGRALVELLTRLPDPVEVPEGSASR